MKEGQSAVKSKRRVTLGTRGGVVGAGLPRGWAGKRERDSCRRSRQGKARHDKTGRAAPATAHGLDGGKNKQHCQTALALPGITNVEVRTVLYQFQVPAYLAWVGKARFGRRRACPSLPCPWHKTLQALAQLSLPLPKPRRERSLILHPSTIHHTILHPPAQATPQQAQAQAQAQRTTSRR